MARIRTIKPDFWTDDALTECSVSARLLFIGTWTFADDNGNIERSAKQLKCKIFPADIFPVEPLIQELIRENLLQEYEVNGKKYLHIRTFKLHQIINRPSKNCLPVYDDSLKTHGALTEHSRTEKEEEKEEEKKKNLTPIDTGAFDLFWDIYPRKKSKVQAKRAWDKINPQNGTREKIMFSVMKHKLSADWLKEGGNFIPYPATFLNNQRWEDEITEPTGKPQLIPGSREYLLTQGGM